MLEIRNLFRDYSLTTPTEIPKLFCIVTQDQSNDQPDGGEKDPNHGVE